MPLLEANLVDGKQMEGGGGEHWWREVETSEAIHIETLYS